MLACRFVFFVDLFLFFRQGGNVEDCIEFILQNFVEMNKLWVRMQHQNIMTDVSKIEKERSDIKLLVGTNLSRLSQLEGVDCSIYTTVIILKKKQKKKYSKK